MSDQVTNTDIAEILFQYAELLEIDGADPFRVQAYETAALSVQNRPDPIADAIDKGVDISRETDIGPRLKAAIEEIVQTGEFIQLIALEESMSPDIVALSHIPGIGAKKVQLLLDRLAPFHFDKLKDRAKSGQLKNLPGIGPKTEQAVIDYFSSIVVEN